MTEDFAKVPPQATDLEEAVLGSFMLDRTACSDYVPLLKVEDFYSPQHQYIFKAVIELVKGNKPVDSMSLIEQLKSMGNLDKAGGMIYLVKLTSRVSSAANTEHHIGIIKQKSMARQLIALSTNAIRSAYDETVDIFDLTASVSKLIDGLSESEDNSIYTAKQALGIAYKRTVEIADKSKADSSDVIGVPSGITELDKITCGWANGDLIVLAGRPSMGKTALAMSFARNASRRGKKVAVFSLEMSVMQLAIRLMAMNTKIPMGKINKGSLSDQEWSVMHNWEQYCRDMNIFIDDTAAISVFALKAKARRLARIEGIELIIIDYLQLMRGDESNKSGNREQEISYISRSLKALAKELSIPVIALSQLSRKVEERADKHPMLSDLRESGAIEQDADLIIFPFRPEKYGLKDENKNDYPANYAEINIAKFRNGPAGPDIFIACEYDGPLTEFKDAGETFHTIYGPNMRTIGERFNNEPFYKQTYNKQQL